MTHTCEYCHKVQDSGSTIDGLTCKCPSSDCEIESKVVCPEALCQLKFKIDWYKLEMERANTDIAKLKALNNQFRIANIGSIAAQRLVDNGTLDITGIKLFCSKQKITWDEIPIETGYILMCLHQEFAEQWGKFLNEKAVKVQIRKELIDKTQKNLAKNEKLRNGSATIVKGEVIDKKITKAKLTDFEKVVLHNKKTFNCTTQQAIDMAHAMGLQGEMRPETKFE